MSVLIWVQTVCKGYISADDKTNVGLEYANISPILSWRLINSSDPDQNRQNVGSDLVTNCL